MKHLLWSTQINVTEATGKKKQETVSYPFSGRNVKLRQKSIEDITNQDVWEEKEKWRDVLGTYRTDCALPFKYLPVGSSSKICDRGPECKLSLANISRCTTTRHSQLMSRIGQSPREHLWWAEINNVWQLAKWHVDCHSCSDCGKVMYHSLKQTFIHFVPQKIYFMVLIICKQIHNMSWEKPTKQNREQFPFPF